MNITGLKRCRVGEPLPKGVRDEGAADLIKAFTKINQPTSEGITLNVTAPSSTKLYRAGESSPYAVLRDPTSGSQEVTWVVPDFDDETKKFYFGDAEFSAGETYEGEKAFAFDGMNGGTIVFARLKYIAVLSGSMNNTSGASISVSAEIMAPEQGGAAWDAIPTPEYTEDTGM